LKRLPRALVLAMLGLAPLGIAQAATISIQVLDSAGEGFNDTTPFAPIGGNPATTLGQARLNVFNRAAQLWSGLININVDIVVEAKFDPQACTASSGTLGSAGPKWIYHDFPGAPLANVFYPSALANSLHGSPISASSRGDITATFNSTVGGNTNCLAGQYFYLGYDHQLTGHNNGMTYVADLLGVVLHELGHGLGFLTLVDQNGLGIADSNGNRRLGAFDQFVYDEGLGLFWKEMTATQRASSATGGGNGNPLLAWSSSRTNAQASRESAGLTPQGHVRLNAPASFDSSSSISHWDITATPDLLMEPRYSRNTGNHTDLTSCVLYDIGWTGTRCPDDLLAVAQAVSVNAGVAQAITLAAANANGVGVSYAITAAPTHGALSTLAGSVVTYTPVAGYSGPDQFSFSVSDGISASRPAAVSITVSVPTLVADAQSLAVTSGSALAVTLTAAGGGGGPISYAITAQPGHGTLGAVTGAQVSYTPNAGYIGPDAFSFQASTTLATSPAATVSIAVQAASSSGATAGSSSGGGGGGGGGGGIGAWGLLALTLGLALRLAAPAISARPRLPGSAYFRPRAGAPARRAR
jgi:hypothetical protein